MGRIMRGGKMSDTKITLCFSDSEMKSIEPAMMKYFGKIKKPKTKKESKRLLEMFTSSMFNKGLWALENNESYINIDE